MTNPATLSATAGHGLLPFVTSLPPDRRGRLRNGARPGDFLAAPRCGARARCGGACRQPAMKNGRCRLHGGLSTGPRTPEGRARCARARTIHGGYRAEVRALQAECRFHAQRIRALRLRLTAGHGVLSSKQANRRDAELVLGPPSGRTRGTRRRNGSPATSPDSTSSASPRLRGESAGRRTAPSAGHGVLSFRRNIFQRTLLGCTALGVSVRPAAVTAGHGVLSHQSLRLG